uniref:Uncharacterized protein n=1 Tax=Oncorhynchus tshawytscha TaxID=74940 RepID=A0A8C8ESQ4_ONCTS
MSKPMGLAARPALDQAVALHSTVPECPEVDTLVGGTAVQAEIQVLVVSVFYRVHYFLWHPHSKGQVSAHLPDHDGCTDVACVDLHMLPRHLIHDAQRVGSVAVSTLVCLCVVHLLVHTLLEVLEDDCQLYRVREGRRLELAVSTTIANMFQYVSGILRMKIARYIYRHQIIKSLNSS